MLDSIGLWRALLAHDIVPDLSDSEHTSLLEQPLGERLTQLLVAGALVAPLAQRVLHARLKEVVGEEVERAEEHDARVVARLQRGDEQRGRADRVRVVGDRAVRVVGVGGGRSRQHFDL